LNAPDPAEALQAVIDDLGNLTHDCGQPVVDSCIGKNIAALRAVASTLRANSTGVLRSLVLANPHGEFFRRFSYMKCLTSPEPCDGWAWSSLEKFTVWLKVLMPTSRVMLDRGGFRLVRLETRVVPFDHDLSLIAAGDGDGRAVAP
jgi:hypothetical protein